MNSPAGHVWVSPPLRWLKRNGYTLIFALSILTLAVLVSWWAFFLSDMIREQRAMRYDAMKHSALALAFALVHSGGEAPPIGPLGADDRLAVVTTSSAGPHIAASLAPAWPELCIIVRPEVLMELKADYQRKSAMVIGETSVLLLAIIFSALMLHRITWLERRSYHEMRQFWSRVTHELKTPITGIKAFLQTVQEHDFTREQLAPLLVMALKEVERQEMLAENLLVGQRLERGGSGLQLRTFRLPQYLRDFVEGHRMFLPDNNISLTISCPEETSLKADPDALRVILENLTDNALKYGGSDPHIAWELSTERGQVKISISDNGAGFEPENSERMFEAYQRISEQHSGGKHGTGMGLYISRQLARRMGGDLQASSAGPGSGARFTLTLRMA